MRRLAPEDARLKAATRLRRSWAEHILGLAPEAWPHSIGLEAGSSAALRGADIAALLEWSAAWRGGAQHGLRLFTAPRRIHGTIQELPARLVIPTIDDAVAWAGGDWPAQLARARQRLPALQPIAAAQIDPAALRAVCDLPEHDFAVLLGVVSWLAGNDETGLTARQVPVPGLHSKWVERHRGLLSRLAGRELRLAARPYVVDLTYLDGDHLAEGRRRWDAVAVGDRAAPLYTPRVVVVVENKDSAYFFPPVAGGIAVYGAGDAALTRLPALPWLTGARLFYWGDIDADGYAILNGLRAVGLQITSVLMGPGDYEAYRRFGVDHHPDGRPIAVNGPQLPHLTDAEQQVYAMLTDPGHRGPRRIEQERIPLPDGAAALAALVGPVTPEPVPG